MSGHSHTCSEHGDVGELHASVCVVPGLDDRIAALTAQVATLENEREELLTAPTSRADAASAESFRVVVALTNDLKEARRERDEALSRAAVLCDRLALGRPENRHKDDPRAAYQAGAAKCAWEIRQLARGATNAIHAIADDRNAYAKGRADERADVVCHLDGSGWHVAAAGIACGAHVTGGKGTT